LHAEQDSGFVPGFAPDPSHFGQSCSTATLTVFSDNQSDFQPTNEKNNKQHTFSEPLAASSKLNAICT